MDVPNTLPTLTALPFEQDIQFGRVHVFPCFFGIVNDLNRIIQNLSGIGRLPFSHQSSLVERIGWWHLGVWVVGSNSHILLMASIPFLEVI